jgi:transcriptional enhancer factor
MMLPTRVLPSNAPPLHDGDGLQHASRILQEHSGNRQHNDFGFATEYEQKFDPSVFGENSYACQQQIQQQHPHHVTQQLYHPRPQHRQAWRYGSYNRGYGYPNPEEDAKNQVEADYLYRRFRQSESYVKYRARQSKEDKGNDEQKWPDHLEKAFFRGRLLLA